MRLVHAIRSDGFAGVERHVARLARAQTERGHAVVIVGGDAAAMRSAVASQAVRLRPAVTTFDVLRALRHLSPGADLIHVHMTAAEIAATLASAPHRDSLSTPVVSTRHFSRPRGRGASGRLVAAVARAGVHAQIAVSQFVADRIDGPATMIHPGVDAVPDGRPAGERESVVLMVQRLQPEKRTDIGLRAFASSGLARSGWRLVVAGDGAEREGLVRLAEAEGIGGAVSFLGTRSDVEDLMSRAAIMLAPCPVEGLGLSVLEAMASGLPVVAAASGGHLELLADLDPCALYPPMDTRHAGTSLRELAGNIQRRDAYGRAARQIQRGAFSLSTQAARTDAVYAQVLGGAR